jgi:hypothetical protein
MTGRCVGCGGILRRAYRQYRHAVISRSRRRLKVNVDVDLDVNVDLDVFVNANAVVVVCLYVKRTRQWDCPSSVDTS